jgi:predicted TIM-barrel fold metal-dependent hydrolase
MRTARGRIDVHHHMYPLFYVKEMGANSNWTPSVSLEALAALKALVPVSQILYGSDVPLRTYELTDRGFNQYDGFSPNDLNAINRGNAERLFPD